MTETNSGGIKAIDLNDVGKLYEATWKPLYRFVYYKVHNREETEDIIQETYVKALPHIQEDSIVAENCIHYLRMVSLNIIRDRWRREKRRGIPVNIEDIDPEEAAADDFTQSSGEKEMIRDALNRLNEKHRRVVELRILEGRSVAETARILGETEGNVRVLQYRALQILTKFLEIAGEGKEHR